MIARVTTRTAKTLVGSVGTVDTLFLELPKPVALDCGRELYPVRVAYETYGTLSSNRDNVILVCHALSGDAHAAGFSTMPAAEGTRDGFRAEERDGEQRLNVDSVIRQCHSHRSFSRERPDRPLRIALPGNPNASSDAYATFRRRGRNPTADRLRAPITPGRTRKARII